jgi:uncharacterized membrane protein YidH (DUF202 family)
VVGGGFGAGVFALAAVRRGAMRPLYELYVALSGLGAILVAYVLWLSVQVIMEREASHYWDETLGTVLVALCVLGLLGMVAIGLAV